MQYRLDKDKIAQALEGKDLKTYTGWIAGAMALLADAPEWTAFEHGPGGYVVKLKINGLSGIYWCSKIDGLEPVYTTDDVFDFDASAWEGQSWDGLDLKTNLDALQNPVFVELANETNTALA